MIKRILLALLALSMSAHGAFTIQFDYSYDSGFFSGPNIGRRALLTAAATVFTSQLTAATLAPVIPSGSNTWDAVFSNPSTGADVHLSNPMIAANTFTIYVGARDLPGNVIGQAQGFGYSTSGSPEWLSLFDSKDSATHYEPLGGSITFDPTTDWYFDPNPFTLEPFLHASDFFSSAQHEIAHLLGFDSGAAAFAARTSATGFFTGSHALSVYGGPVPLSADRSHLENDLIFNGSFLTMDPVLSYQTRTNFSNLEFAILQDIGYGAPANPIPPAQVVGTLSVTTSDSSQGTVTPLYRGVTTQAVGSKLLIQATPKPGFVFASWTGDTDSTANPLSIVMSDGLTIQANFIDSPFLNGVGSFYGVFSNGTKPAGTWRLNSNAFGAFSGSLLLDGRKVALKGKLDLTGHYSGTLKTGLPSPRNTADVSLYQDLQTGALSGNLKIDGSSFSFGGVKLPVYNKLNPAAQAGAYTLVFPAQESAPLPEPPQGSGYALLSVDIKGAARMAGKLADGTPLLVVVPLDSQNQLVFSQSLLAGKAALSGALAFPDNDPSNDVEGELLWTRSASSLASAPWKAGFLTRLPSIGSRWIKPASGARVLGALDTSAGLASVTYGATQSTALVSDRNRVQETPPSPNALAVAIFPKTGLFTGSFRDNAMTPGVRRKFAGVFLQKQKRADGFYLASPVSSLPVALTPAP